MGIFQSIAAHLWGKEEETLPTGLIRGRDGKLYSIANHPLDEAATRTKVATMVSEFESRFAVAEKRLSRLEKLTANDIKEIQAELEAAQEENEALQKENEGLTNHVSNLEAPPSSREAEAAKVLAGWGYSEQQILKAAELFKQNEAMIEEFLGGEDEEEPITTVMKKNRLLIDMFLKQKIGQPAGAAKSGAGMGMPPGGIDLRG